VPVITFTFTNTSTSTWTPTDTDTWTPTFTPTPSFTDSFTPTFSATASPSPTASVTDTDTPTMTLTLQYTSTWTLTPTDTFSPTPTFTDTPTFSPTDTFTDTVTVTPTNTPTDSLTPTYTTTAAPPTDTFTPTWTFTDTWTYLPTSTFTDTWTVTQTPTPSWTPIPTWTPTPTPTAALAYVVKVAVYNSSGEMVKVISVNRMPNGVDNVTGESDTVIDRVGDVVYLYDKGLPLGTWDGTNQDGRQVSNGEYYVKVDTTDPYGVVKDVTLTVTVNRKVARLDITIYNGAGEAVRHLTSLEAADLGPVVNAVGLSADVIQPNGTAAGVSPALTISLPNGTTAVWDGRSDTGAVVADGQYYVEVKTEGQGGESTVVVKTVAVMGEAGAKPVEARPNTVTAGSPVAHFYGAAGTTVKVVVYAASGEKVGQAWGAPGTGKADWDSTGKASGVYLAAASTYDASGRLFGRATLTILVGR